MDRFRARMRAPFRSAASWQLLRSAVACTLLAWLGVGPSSSFAQEDAAEPAVDLFRLTGVEIAAEGEGAVVRISGEGSLVWSRVHKVEDSLLAVVVPDATLPTPVETTGEHPLIVRAQSGPSPAGRRQAVMVAVRLAAPVKHVLDVEDGELLLRLSPRAAPAFDLTGGTGGESAGEPEPPSESPASVPKSFKVEANPLGLAGAELLRLDESIGTAAHPFLGPSPEGSPATALQGVERRELEGRRGYLLRGEGHFAYSCFFLPDPDRFVVDLNGVRNRGGNQVLEMSDEPPVERVRTAQFKNLPDPVTRVVFDLRARGKVRTLRTSEGLLLFFE